MPYRDPIKRKEYMKKWREQNADKIKKDQAIRYSLFHVSEYKKRKSYFIEWQRKNRDKVKANKIAFKDRKIVWLSAHLGGPLRCDRCKYNKSFAALQLHHLNPCQKENSSDGLASWLHKKSLKKFQTKILETDFLLLCANCHAELHAGLWNYGR